MGCTGSITHHLQNTQQPLKNYSVTIIRHQSKIIKLSQHSSDGQTQQSFKSKQTLAPVLANNQPQNEVVKKKQQKIKQLKNNKDFVQLSIQTSYCVNKLLNALAQNDIFQDQELKNLLSKNNQALIKKQNRYKNLEARQEKMELQLKKQITRNQRLKSKNHKEKKTVKSRPELNVLKSSQNHQSSQAHSLKVYDLFSGQNKENIPTKNQCHSQYEDQNYKTKFNRKIDSFRTEFNTLASKKTLQF